MRDVKSPAGSVRAERAALTRRRIVESARRRFAETGYAATTLKEIAAGAGVAVQTVYAIYGSKAAILRALRDSLMNDVVADEAFGRAMEADDPASALRAFASSIRHRWEAGHDIVTTTAKAAAADPSIGADLQVALAARRRGIRRLAEHVATLTAGDASRVEALIDALTMPEVYEQLVAVHGWTPDAYQEWLANTLVEQLAQTD